MNSFANSLLFLINIAIDDAQLDTVGKLVAESLKMETVTKDEYDELAKEGKRRRGELKCEN